LPAVVDRSGWSVTRSTLSSAAPQPLEHTHNDDGDRLWKPSGATPRRAAIRHR